MAYISLYRKYRPQTFEDVVGQEHVTTTLRNSIQEGRIASGYLFTGTRGTAKTTCARIFAKALNCIGPDGSLTSPTPEPCGVCGPCKSIAASSFVDVLEMDAASHGKVDDVRDLVASIKFPPMEGRYKVYIIDEAHQLSRDAMDAFLKTLEEPPDRVVFILATTELDKLPITIASRCQVYEFKRGSVAQIGSRISDVLKAEGVKADPAAVALIARAADGSYRDSLSLLEQVLAFQREHMTAQDVTTVLGTISEDVLTQVVNLIADSDAAGAFALAGSILESGKDVRQFLKSLSERFRDLLFVGVGASPAGAGEIADSASLLSQSARFAPASLLHALETITAAEQETRRSSQHRLILELALLRLMHLPSVAQFAPVSPPIYPNETPILEDQNGTKKRAEANPTPKWQGEEAESIKSQPLSSPVSGGVPRSGEVGSPPMSEPAIPYDMPPPLPDSDVAELPEEDDEIGMEAPVPGDEELDVLPFDEETNDARPSRVIVSEEQQDEAEDFMHVQQVAVETTPMPAPKPPPAADAPPELIRLQKSWQEVLNLIGSRSPAGVQDVKAARPVALLDHTVVLEFTSQFSFDRVDSKERGRKMIEEIINKTLGADPGAYKIKCVMEGHALPTRAPQNKIAQSVAPSARTEAPRGPFVDEVIAVFGGKLLDDDDVKG